VRSETGGRNYDQVILPTGRQVGTWLARVLRRDPIIGCGGAGGDG
jgi:hypothetical protein